MKETLYHRFTGYDELTDLLSGSDEDALAALDHKPALICITGSEGQGRARFVSCLLHGNEDSGYRAVLDMLRRKDTYPFDLWVFIGNVRAACQEGWFAHRYQDDQEDFNRVWGLGHPTTRMRRCADAVLAELGTISGLEAAVDLHNNTGDNPPYAVLPVWSDACLGLAALCADTAMVWGLKANALMEVLSDRCPVVAVECGMIGLASSTAFAMGVLERFLAADLRGLRTSPERPLFIWEMNHRVTVRPEVSFGFGGMLSDCVDLVLAPGLDATNFGLLPRGTIIGHAHCGAAMPLMAMSMQGQDDTERCFALQDDGSIVVSRDLTPAMMTTTVAQARRDCLFYLARRRA
ncbi:MAG: hypothetical protein GEU81_15750 [Nitriliruptorales bacterium]|nr:hypothetical protein [Nitriliruptorales bacterium]